MINYDKAPHTGGKYYEFIDQATFESYYTEGQRYTLSDLKIPNKYKFYRAAKNFSDELVFMTIVGELCAIDDNLMFFMHAPTKGKYMLLDGFLETWYFIPQP